VRVLHRPTVAHLHQHAALLARLAAVVKPHARPQVFARWRTDLAVPVLVIPVNGAHVPLTVDDDADL